MQHKCRNLYTGKNRPDVDERVQQHGRLDRAGAGREPLQLGKLNDGVRACRVAWHHGLPDLAGAPHRHGPRNSFFQIIGEEVCRNGKAAEQDELRHAFRIGRGKQYTHGGAFGEAHDDRALRADAIHDRANVIHALLKRRRARYPIGQSLASFVERDHAGKCRQAPQEGGIAGQFVRELDMRYKAGDHHDVDGPGAHHLVGDVDVAAERITRVRQDKVAHRSRFQFCSQFRCSWHGQDPACNQVPPLP